MIASLLSSIAAQLNEDAVNYTVFLDAKVLARSASGDPREYIRSAFGHSALVETIEATSGAVVVKTIEDSLTYAGSAHAGPPQRTLAATNFHLLLDQLVGEVRKIFVASESILEFRLSEGHPAYPVYWDFGFLFLLTDKVFILIGSSSD